MTYKTILIDLLIGTLLGLGMAAYQLGLTPINLLEMIL